MKICTKCKSLKETQEFYVCKRNPSGLTPHCKSCIKSYERSNNGKESHRRYYQSRREALTSQARKYKNTPAGIETQKRYDQSERGRLSAQQCARRRRERKRKLDMRLKSKDIAVIYERFKNRCANCGSNTNLEIDHHYPLIAGFGLSLNNAVLLCKSCNCSKSNKMPEEFYRRERLEYIEGILYEAA